MPCKTSMAGCRRGCLHRQMVQEYRLARHAAVLKREEVTGGYKSEIEAYGPIITFKTWLESLAGSRREDQCQSDSSWSA